MGFEFLSPLSKIQQKVGESKYVICRTETEEKDTIRRDIIFS